MVTFHHPYPRVGQTRAIARSGDLRHCRRRNRGLKDVSPPKPRKLKGGDTECPSRSVSEVVGATETHLKLMTG